MLLSQLHLLFFPVGVAVVLFTLERLGLYCERLKHRPYITIREKWDCVILLLTPPVGLLAEAGAAFDLWEQQSGVVSAARGKVLCELVHPLQRCSGACSGKPAWSQEQNLFSASNNITFFIQWSFCSVKINLKLCAFLTFDCIAPWPAWFLLAVSWSRVVERVLNAQFFLVLKEREKINHLEKKWGRVNGSVTGDVSLLLSYSFQHTIFFPCPHCG